MFVQIIEGKVRDAHAMKERGEVWQRELRPGATGFAGVTAGVTADGRAITIVRFESGGVGVGGGDAVAEGRCGLDVNTSWPVRRNVAAATQEGLAPSPNCAERYSAASWRLSPRFLSAAVTPTSCAATTRFSRSSLRRAIRAFRGRS